MFQSSALFDCQMVGDMSGRICIKRFHSNWIPYSPCMEDFINIGPENHPNVGKHTIYGANGDGDSTTDHDTFSASPICTLCWVAIMD